MRLLTLLLSCILAHYTYAQFAVDKIHQQMRIGDEITVCQLKFQKNIWNLSDVQVINKDHNVCFLDILPEHITKISGGQRTYYEQNSDGIMILGYEDPLSKVNYNLKEKWLLFPMTIRQQTEGYFNGEGIYCDKLFMREFGYYKTEADTLGTIVVNDEDSINNVLRIHTTRYKSRIFTPIDTIHHNIPEFTIDSISNFLANDDSKLKEEIYRYFAPGYRYPILLSYQLTDTKNNVISQNLYYFPAENQTFLPLDEENAIIRECGNLNSANELKASNSDINYIFHYDTQGKNVQLNLTAKKELTINLAIADRAGIIYKKRNMLLQSGENTDINISVDDLRPGEYILNISSDENIYIEKFSK